MTRVNVNFHLTNISFNYFAIKVIYKRCVSTLARHCQCLKIIYSFISLQHNNDIKKKHFIFIYVHMVDTVFSL